MAGWVYLLANRRNGTLYTGVTGDLAQRVSQHKAGNGSPFARKHGATRLVHAEPFDGHSRCHRAGEAAEEMAARVESLIDRA